MTNPLAIFGGKGFIGTHLCKLLDKQKTEYHLYNDDILDEKSLQQFFSKYHPQTCIHLAGSFQGTSEELYQNVLTTQAILEEGIKQGLKKIIYASTGAVYGAPVGETSIETDPPKPNTLYGLTKFFAEQVIQFAASTQNVSYVILRFCNVYGPGNRKGVIYSFLKDIKTKKITLYGDGSAARQFLHVTDACRAILAAINYSGNGVFNITNPTPMTIKDLIAELQKRHSFTIEKHPREDKPNCVLLNPARAIKELKFKAQIQSIPWKELEADIIS